MTEKKAGTDFLTGRRVPLGMTQMLKRLVIQHYRALLQHGQTPALDTVTVIQYCRCSERPTMASFMQCGLHFDV